MGPRAPRHARDQEVATTTLDTFCAANGVSKVDVLALDVQGAERTVLEGGRRMLAEARIGLVYAEVILAPTYRGQPGFEGVLAALQPHGYALYGLFDEVWGGDRLLQADALFASPSVLAELERA